MELLQFEISLSWFWGPWLACHKAYQTYAYQAPHYRLPFPLAQGGRGGFRPWLLKLNFAVLCMLKEGFNHHHSAWFTLPAWKHDSSGENNTSLKKETNQEASQICCWEDGSAWKTVLPLPVALVGFWASNSKHILHFWGEDSPLDKNTHPEAETKEKPRAVSGQFLCCFHNDGDREEGIWLNHQPRHLFRFQLTVAAASPANSRNKSTYDISR